MEEEGEDGREGRGGHRVLLESLPGKNNSPSFQWCVCVQHLGFLLLCDKHTQRRGDLYARGAIENCLLRDAALMSSLHVSTKPLGGDGRTEDWGFVLCHQHDCDQERSAVQYPSVSQCPLQRGREAIQQGLGKSVGRMWADSMAVSACAIVTYHKASSYCLTSFVAFLRWLGFLGKTWVQPGGGLAVMTVIWKRYRALSTV